MRNSARLSTRGASCQHCTRKAKLKIITDTASFRILPQIFYSEEYTFFGHSPGGTWHGRDVAIVLWLVERPLAVVSVLFGCVVLALGIAKGVRRRKIQYRRVEEGTLGA